MIEALTSLVQPVSAAPSSATRDVTISVIGALLTAAVIALMTMVLRLLSERRKKECAEHAELEAKVEDLERDNKTMMSALRGGDTDFDGHREGLVQQMRALTADVSKVTDKVAALQQSAVTKEELSAAESRLKLMIGGKSQ
jgi:hypothetical protein